MSSKKTKKGRSFAFLLFVLVISLTALLEAVYINRVSNDSYSHLQANNSNETKEYKSKDLKISINVPSGFRIEDKFASISLIKTEGVINIGRNGTNFESIEGYLDDLSLKNRITITDKEKVMINNINAIRGVIKSSGGPQREDKVYFFYNNFAVYSIATSIPALFDELDEIAQSFRYTP